MKGKNLFTANEIAELERLITLRNKIISSKQKTIRQQMRNIGFYGKDDWGITDLQLLDLQTLIKSGQIKVIGDKKYISAVSIITPVLSSILIQKRDEHYVIDICDKVLGLTASRQHKFDFLLGDENSNGKTKKLPLDCYYEKFNLVIEYLERQHTESINFFDKPNKITVSGVNRGEQRRIYDERRRHILKRYQIELIEISYSDFKYDNQKRIIRNPKEDEDIVKVILRKYL